MEAPVYIGAFYVKLFISIQPEHNMPLKIIRNDITNVSADAIVNSANNMPIFRSGVDSRIHKKAGPQLLAVRKKIGIIPFGNAAISPAYDLNAKYVIHAVSPVWQGGNAGEERLLRECYDKCLALACENKCESIAFPLLSSGNNSFPKDLALKAAIEAFSAFLLENEMLVYLVVFDKSSYALSEKLFFSIESVIDDNYVKENYFEEGFTQARRKHREEYLINPELSSDSLPFQLLDKKPNLEKMLSEITSGFSDTLLKIIDERGMSDPEVYKKANMNRKLFSKIKNNPNYRPAKTTAIALAFALELDLESTRDFIAKAGYALSHSSKFDIIVEYFLVNRNYNLFELNEVLFAFDQATV